MKNAIILLLLVLAQVIPLKGYTRIPRIDKSELKQALRSDGLYNTYDTSLMRCGERHNSHYSLFETLVIINTEKINYNYGEGDLNLAPLKLTHYDNKFLLESVGSYQIKGSSIVASVPINLFIWGMRLKPFIAHFEGEIINQDTIINWHMVAPYPKAPKKFNNNFKDLIAPKLLYFIESKELLGLDSLFKKKLGENGNRKN